MPARSVRLPMLAALWCLTVCASMAADAAVRIVSGDVSQYGIGPAPSWIRAEAPAPTGTAATEASDGVEYLALDRQVRLTARGSDFYVRTIQRIVSETGVEEASTITLDFDPHSDNITLHAVWLRRGSIEIDQLAAARISVLRRESRLERGLLDGELTLSLLLEDVRPGDTIDYSYSRHHYDEVLGNRFFDEYTTQWGTPVQWSRLRLLQPIGRSVQVQQLGTDLKPTVRTAAGWRESVWEWRDLPGIHNESQRPSWSLQYPRIRFSEWRNWSEVVEWGLAEYRPATLSPQLRELIAQWTSATESQPERILHALRFVQDQIRYTGIEIGAGAYRPTSPDRVLQRRYGDCKDKVLLLVTLLRGLDVDARPALVNTDLRRHIAEVLPSPGAFDHAIVRVRHDRRTYWFDATASLQGGSLQKTAQAHFGAALVIEPAAASLESISDEFRARPTTEITEEFDLRSGLYEKGTMVATTIYRGAAADWMRRDLQSRTAEDLTRRYLEYYREWYPGVRSLSNIKTSDDRGENRIEVTERYEIDPAFDVEDDGSLSFDVNAYVVKTQAAAPKLAVRTTPLAVEHPVNVRYRAIVQLPQSWSPSTGVVTVEDPAFRYRSDIKYASRRFDASYEFRTLADHVDAKRVSAYADKLEQVREDSTYTFTHPGRARLPESRSVNLAMVVAILAGIGAGVLLLMFLHRRTPEIVPAPAIAPVGIGGWLLLPALQTCVAPLVVAFSLFSNLPLMDESTWSNVSAGTTAFMTQLLKFGCLAIVCMGVALFIASGYAIFLMFTRSRRFPFAYVLLVWITVAWVAIDAIVASGFPGTGAKEMAATYGAVLRSFFSAMLWTAYMLKSTRVRATFVRDDAALQPAVATQPA